MMKYLWLDDERPVAKYFNGGIAEVARTYEDAIDIFLELKQFFNKNNIDSLRLKF